MLPGGVPGKTKRYERETTVSWQNERSLARRGLGHLPDNLNKVAGPPMPLSIVTINTRCVGFTVFVHLRMGRPNLVHATFSHGRQVKPHEVGARAYVFGGPLAHDFPIISLKVLHWVYGI